MKCPHCTVAINESWGSWQLHQEPEKSPNAGQVWHVRAMVCPECGEMIAFLARMDAGYSQVYFRTMVWPKSGRRPLPPEVTGRWKTDFAEAVDVLPTSAKASAALSRRMLQDIIREKAGIKRRNLDEEIQAVVNAREVPSWLSENLDAVRVVGNFAAHPEKSTNTGEVEPGEAEWLLEVLEGMFDFYFVQPERAQKRQAGLNAKLREMGRPELKNVGSSSESARDAEESAS